MYIKNGKLFIEDKSVFRHSPNFYNSVQQKFLVLHYTAGRGIDSTVNFMSNSSSMRSSHFVVGRDGKIAQLVHTSNGAWHAGKSTYMFNGETYISLNKYSIGIEIDNYGYLEKKKDEFYSWFGVKVSKDKVIQAVHKKENHPRYWEIYLSDQYMAVLELCKFLHSNYKFLDIVGHDDISKTKIDPGPAWPMEQFKKLVFA